ncbi:ShlB/FhaC/HecB family hemolysin secretion/activation protein [Thiomonas sp.]|uniref:ShlB/FhaC/HecB family hemolysin secretion/activation protein n=1 Tax=Thiomonas sp. TaxID=2047785 RepID=UPI0026106FBA|nr:ShlB/FhaC/HecB family hemolysin secretion/activation protein [Thiomonas sp.]
MAQVGKTILAEDLRTCFASRSSSIPLMTAFDLQTFTPPPEPPAAVVELKLPKNAHGSLTLVSHGYTYEVSGDTLLGAQTLEQVLASAANPNAAVAELYRAYQKRGHILVAVRAEMQPGQRVVISIIEGQITQINAEDGLDKFYRGVEFDPTVTGNALIRRNIQAQAYAQRNGRGFTAGLKPAPQPGGTELDIGAPPDPDFRPVQGILTLGNYGSRYVGGSILGESLTIHPGAGTEFNLAYSHGLPNLQKDSTGSRYDAASVGGSIWTPYGLYGLSYTSSHYRIGLAGAPLNPAGKTEIWSLTGSQLVWASATGRLSLTQNLSHVLNQQTVFSGLYTLVDQNYNYINLGAQYSQNVSLGELSGVVNASASASLGLTAPRGTLSVISTGAPASRFHYWQAALSWSQNLGKGWLGSLSASGQYGLDTLPQNQQWVLGGYGSLAAWTPGILSGDGGYALRAMIQTPGWQWGRWQLTAQGFAEQGAVTMHYTPVGTAGWRMLADVGLGITMTSPWKTSLSVQAARPVASKNVTSSVYSNQRAVYLVLQQPF